MPNWVYIQIQITTSDKSRLKRFKDKEQMTMREIIGTTLPDIYNIDTTNAPRSRDAIWFIFDDIPEGKKAGEPRFNSDEEYEEYLKEYNEAKRIQQETYGIIGWYNYNCATLGTKWDRLADISVTENDFGGTIDIYLETAWSFPDPWYEDLVNLYEDDWNVECTAREESGAFNLRFHNLELMDSWDEYETPDGSWVNIYDRLDGNNLSAVEIEQQKELYHLPIE